MSSDDLSRMIDRLLGPILDIEYRTIDIADSYTRDKVAASARQAREAVEEMRVAYLDAQRREVFGT